MLIDGTFKTTILSIVELRSSNTYWPGVRQFKPLQLDQWSKLNFGVKNYLKLIYVTQL